MRFALILLIPLLVVMIMVGREHVQHMRARPDRRNRAYCNQIASISLAEQRKRQLEDWERRFRLSMSHEEYVLTLIDMPEGVCAGNCEPKLHRLSAGATDSQVRR